MRILLFLLAMSASQLLQAQGCIPVAPSNLQSVFTLGSGATLSWDAVPGSVACQVTGEELGTGLSQNRVVSGLEVNSAFIPEAFLTPDADYSWKVRCACSLAPLDVSPYSVDQTFSVFSSNTLGNTLFNDSLTEPGYNLFIPHNQNDVWLVDNCGRVVNVWEDTVYVPGNSVEILPGGRLLRLGSLGRFSNPVFTAGGAGTAVQLRTWNNGLLWEYVISDTLERMHHDFAPLPNGNVLLIVWEYRSGAEAISNGRDPSMMPDGEVHPDKIVELQPIFPDSANVVWEWKSWDHLIQDYDPAQANFGVVADHPELIDINKGDMVKDWHHMNSIHYDEERDLIFLSVPTFSEFWVIDHSTTTAEAAGHTGGDRGMGGDILYRWGNPQMYNRGSTADQKLDYQHDVQIIGDFLEPGHPDIGKLLLFNNRIGGDFSTVDQLVLPWDSLGNFPPLAAGQAWGPDSAEWRFIPSTPSDLYSSGLSGAQRLQNGNTLIDVGREGRAFEILPDGTTVWAYQNPLFDGVALDQGTDVSGTVNLMFRFNRYPPDYSGFDGRDLTPGDPIEGNPSVGLCPLDVPLARLADSESQQDQIRVYPNPSSATTILESIRGSQIDVYTIDGSLKGSWLVNQGRVEFSVADWSPGIYLVRSDRGETARFFVTY